MVQVSYENKFLVTYKVGNAKEYFIVQKIVMRNLDMHYLSSVDVS